MFYALIEGIRGSEGPKLMCKFYGKLEVLRNVGSSQVKGQDFSFLFFFLLGIKPSELCLPLPPRFEHQVTLCLGYYEDLADEFTKANWFQLARSATLEPLSSESGSFEKQDYTSSPRGPCFSFGKTVTSSRAINSRDWKHSFGQVGMNSSKVAPLFAL